MAVSPDTTLTFLAADIPASAASVEMDPAAVADSARFATALHAAAKANGIRLQAEAGRWAMTFETPVAALKAALDLIGTLRAGSAEPIGKLALYSARMADEVLAAGSVPARAVVLLQAAHGGQVLMSAATRELLGDDLPAGVELRDLGPHRLRDLHQPEHIFQVIAPGVTPDFPALLTLDRFDHNLPIQGTPLIGRAEEAAAVRELFASGARLVTLTGPGGTGKTRLALEVVATLIEAFDGAYFVPLAPVSDPGLVSATIAQTLGIREIGESLVAALQAYLRDRRLLLLLDNFEQVIEAAPLVDELLHEAPRLAVLVTSRERLHLPEEYVFDVPPLAVPDPRTLPSGDLVATLERYEAVRLFVQRSKLVSPGFVLTDTNSPAVAEICYRLDGLPLAIELAASRVQLLPPPALLARLARGLHLLSGSAFNLPPRQQTLRGTIGVSYEMLSPEEQRLFQRLGVFAGGCTPVAVAAVCGQPGDGLRSLTDKSLLRREQRAPERYFMLDTIRQYALERLRESGEADLIRQRFADFYLALAEQAEPELTGPRQKQWLDELAVEHNNMRAVLSWALERGQAELALRLAIALWRFWHTRGYLSEGQTWLQSALGKAGAMDAGLRAQALYAAAALAWAQGAYTNALTYGKESLAMCRELGDPRGIAGSLNVLGLLYQDLGDHTAARAVLEESNALSRAMGDVRGIGVTLLNLGESARALGDFPAARRLIEESLQSLRAVGDTRYIASALDYLGNVVYEQREYAAAHALLAESLALRWTLRDMSGIARTLGGLARVISTLGADTARAERAARLYGTADAVRASIGAPIPAADRPRYEHDLDRVRSYLGEQAFQAAWAEGRSMDLERAIVEAQQTPVLPAAGLE